jgi:hypothetical protein
LLRAALIHLVEAVRLWLQRTLQDRRSHSLVGTHTWTSTGVPKWFATKEDAYAAIKQKIDQIVDQFGTETEC